MVAARLVVDYINKKMELRMKRLIKILMFISLVSANRLWAISEGAGSSGGGDASEQRVDEIRSDILLWIKKGGAKGLTLPDEVTYESYVTSMTEILQPKKVVVGFVNEDGSKPILVHEVQKTCRNFLSEIDNRLHIECDLNRFANTSDQDQYRLIHHEYAGLANLERHDGAASDYFLSGQLTDFLTKQVVWRLAIKRDENRFSSRLVTSCKAVYLTDYFFKFKAINTLKCSNKISCALKNYLNSGDYYYVYKVIGLNLDEELLDEVAVNCFESYDRDANKSILKDGLQAIFKILEEKDVLVKEQCLYSNEIPGWSGCYVSGQGIGKIKRVIHYYINRLKNGQPLNINLYDMLRKEINYNDRKE